MLDEVLPLMRGPLAAQLGDLRSQPVRAACGALEGLVQRLGGAMAPLVPGVLPQLLKNLYVSVKAISAISSSTMLRVVAAAPSDKALDVPRLPLKPVAVPATSHAAAFAPGRLSSRTARTRTTRRGSAPSR